MEARTLQKNAGLPVMRRWSQVATMTPLVFVSLFLLLVPCAPGGEQPLVAHHDACPTVVFGDIGTDPVVLEKQR